MAYSSENYQTFQTYRPVPLGLKLKMLFGGTTNLIGWVFFGLGMILTTVFIGQIDFSSFYFDENTPTAQGKITNVQNTNTTVNDRLVRACYYEFKTPSGEILGGVSYTTEYIPELGSEVTVQYLSDNPRYSRVQGMARGSVPIWTLFVLIFPIVGLSFILYNIITALKHIRLLRNGIITKGKYLRKEATNTRINDKLVYKLFFGFTAEDGQKYEAVAKSHIFHKLLDEDEETLFYDRNFPEKAVLKDSLPGAPKLKDDGSIEAPSFPSLVSALFVPAVAITVTLIVLIIFL